jgi:YidC/Oxa1 family membrane protein insertase
VTNFLGVPVDAAYHLVSGFTGFLTPALGGVAAVAAIILFTVAERALLMPLSLRALRGQAAMAKLAPQLQVLRQKYAKQPERLQREMTELYRREGTSMLAGITPFLLQWPLVSVMYLLFRSAQIGGTPNTLLSHDLLGVPLGSHWLAGAGALSGAGLVFLGLFILLAVAAWLAVRLGQLMTPEPPATAQVAPGARRAPGTPGAAAVPGRRTTGWLLRVLPYVTVVIAAFLPLAAGIYLLTSTAWALAERAFFWKTGRIPGALPSPERAPVAARDRA